MCWNVQIILNTFKNVSLSQNFVLESVTLKNQLMVLETPKAPAAFTCAVRNLFSALLVKITK